MIESTLRLFKAIQVENKIPRAISHLERTLKYGYILDPSIPQSSTVLNTIEKVVGLSGEQANASFHKSWAVVRDTPMETLVIQQIVHYITTYGFERLGIYDKDTVYIPKEALNIPEISLKELPITVVRAMTREEILAGLVELGSGVALMKETLDDMMSIIKSNHYNSDFVQGIKNRELKALLCDLYGIVPTEPEEFLRYLVGKLVGEALIIKNDELINKIKASDRKILDELLEKAPSNLASVFFRYKPLFLAMKSISANKSFFNRLRKQANRMHVPLPGDYLNDVTSQIKNRALDPDKLAGKLEGASIFRKVRLANALRYRLHSTDSVVYRVRNGRGWATEFDWPESVGVRTKQALEVVYESIVSDIRKNVEGKTIYMPKWMHYTVPATEKQFTGNFPTGSSVAISGDTIVGIHWTNTDGRRIDLDLSVIDESGKTGWDSYYRSDDLKVLFSGDMTDAPPPHGATELFYFNGAVVDPKIIMVNFYNFASDEVECDLLVAQEKVTKFTHNYMVDPNKILARAKTNISKKQNVIGLVASINGENRVYFANMSIGTSITAGMNDQSMRARAYLINSVTTGMDLRELLFFAEAVVVDERPEEGEYYDLSPEALDKMSILKLLSNK